MREVPLYVYVYVYTHTHIDFRSGMVYNNTNKPDAERRQDMKKNRRKKLTRQISLAIAALFTVLTAAVIALMYQSAISGFLQSQNASTSELLVKLLEDIRYSGLKEEKEYCISAWEKNPEQMGRPNTEEETEYFVEHIAEYANMDFELRPDPIKEFYFRSEYSQLSGDLETMFEQTKQYSHICWIDMKEPYTGMVLYENNRKAESRHLGDYYDISKSPALQRILNGNSDEIVFERIRDFPDPGYYYIGYKPFYDDGHLRYIIGLTYKWDSIRKNLLHHMVIISGISIASLLVIVLILHFMLRRLATKPISQIESAIMQYSKHKAPAQIVKNMYEVQAQNEIGYLADVISDFVMEIDLSNKENIRIATERERAEKELYQAEVQIMVSQIRPHFMYNTLSSIAMLCEIDPITARDATIHLTRYLRCNMDSLKQTRPVSFEKELEHLKHYLYIEKLRFEDLLNIEYDIQTTDFELPLLSIQPIVENAVKHGVGMKEDGGTVTIATRETETAYEVIISDDGVGFDTDAPKKEDGRSHVGMENTRKRLKDMCDADIVITSKPGEGTTVRVIIPKKKKEEPNQ